MVGGTSIHALSTKGCFRSIRLVPPVRLAAMHACSHVLGVQVQGCVHCEGLPYHICAPPLESSAGPNLTLTNYLLLALAIFQFPFALWLCNVQLPVLSHLAEATPVAAAATAAATGAAEAAKAAGKVGTGFAGRAGGRA